MASAVDTAGEPIPTSAVLMASSKHISTMCRSENVAFLQCKKNDPNPEKCLAKGQQVTRCVLSLFPLLFMIFAKTNRPSSKVFLRSFWKLSKRSDGTMTNRTLDFMMITMERKSAQSLLEGCFIR